MGTIITPEQSRQARKELGNWTQKEVAEEVGTARSKLGMFEAGRQNPSDPWLENLRSFYEGHGVTFEDDQAEEPEAEPEGEKGGKAKAEGKAPAKADRPVLALAKGLSVDEADDLEGALEAAAEDLGQLLATEAESGDIDHPMTGGLRFRGDARRAVVLLADIGAEVLSAREGDQVLPEPMDAEAAKAGYLDLAEFFEEEQVTVGQLLAYYLRDQLQAMAEESEEAA